MGTPNAPSEGPRSADRRASEDNGVGRSSETFGNALYWSYVLSGGRIFVNLGVSLLLARLLGPEAFGVIAMANVYIYFVDLLVRQGLPAALIQRPDLERSHLDTAFWMILGVIALLIPLSIVLSGWWAAVNGVPELRGVIIGLTPVLALRGLSVVQEARLRRRLDYRTLAVRTNLAVVGGGITGVGLALAGMGVGALIGQQIALALIEVLVLWTASDWRPRIEFSASRARELLGFSGLSSVAGVGVFLQDRVDALLIGLLFGPAAVGLYRMAARLASQAVEAVSGALQSVSLPELAKHALEPEILNRRVRELVHLATLLAVPALGVLALVSQNLLTVLGPEWVPATVGLQLLCASAAFQVPAAMSGPMLQAAGRPGLFGIATWAAAVASGVSFLVAGFVVQGAPIDVQLTALAVSRLVAMVSVIVAVLLPLLDRSLGLRPSALVSVVLPVVTAVTVTVVMGGALWETLDLMRNAPPFVALCVNGLYATVLVASVTLAVDARAREWLWHSVRRRRPLVRDGAKVGSSKQADRPPSTGRSHAGDRSDR